MINETVNNLTQAICNEWTKDGDRVPGPGIGLVLPGGVTRTPSSSMAGRISNCFERRPSISSPRTSAMSRITGWHGSRNG